jgi:hypothetical protein
MLEQLNQFFDQVDSLSAAPIANAISMPIDQVRLICVFLVNYPIGWF